LTEAGLSLAVSFQVGIVATTTTELTKEPVAPQSRFILLLPVTDRDATGQHPAELREAIMIDVVIRLGDEAAHRSGEARSHAIIIGERDPFAEPRQECAYLALCVFGEPSVWVALDVSDDGNSPRSRSFISCRHHRGRDGTTDAEIDDAD
jgi:hypothetical protein